MTSTVDLAPVSTVHAPTPIGPYSQAVRMGNILHISGQMGIDPASSRIVDPTDVKAQTEQVLTNLDAILRSAGAGMEHVAKTTIFLTDMADFATVNAVYAERFDRTPPARSCVAVTALPNPHALVEIEAVAWVTPGER